MFDRVPVTARSTYEEPVRGVRRGVAGPFSPWAVAFVLALGLVLAFAATGPLVDAAQAAPSRSELRDKLDANRQQLESLRENIQQAEETKKSAWADISVLDQKIEGLEGELARVTRERDAAEDELEQTRAELDRLEQAIRDKRKTIDKASKDLRAQQQRLDERASTIYKKGKVAYIEVLLNTERLTDLISRFSLLSRVIEQDNDLLDQIERLKNRVSAEKAALEEQEARLDAVAAQQEQVTARLAELVNERVGTLQQLDSARSEKRQIVSKAESDQAAWEKQENELLNESARIEAEIQGLTASTPAGSVTGTGQMIWPVQGRVSSNFGYRVHPIFGTRKMHTGIDLAAGSGTSIKAADAGTVVYAGWRGGYGKTVIVNHGGGLTTLYAHQSAILVSTGQSVGKGTVVGRVGSTGYSTGPHLHFEVRQNGSPVNPRNFL